MISLLVSLAGLSALVAASPLPAGPEVTAAPSKRSLVERLNEPTTYSGCSFSQTVYTNVNQWGVATQTSTQDLCSCSGDYYPSFSTSTFTGSFGATTVLELCYDATTTIASSSAIVTSAYPSVRANGVIFGDQNPSDVVLNLGTSCLNGGCPSSGSLTGSYIPTTSQTTVFSGTTIVENTRPTPVIISWTLDADLTSDDYGTYFGALAVLADMNGTNSFGPFNYWGEGDSASDPAPRGTDQYQYRGPGNVGLSRFDFPSNVKTAMEHANLQFTSELEDDTSGPSCGDIEGPIASVLGLIPEIGSFFGILGSVICSEATDAGA